MLGISHQLVNALSMAFAMFWEILWALILGFGLSAIVQAVVSKKEVSRLLPDDSPDSIIRATLLGAASSSCSYAAVALARSLFRKGANFSAAIAFEVASTNLVVELGIILAILIGWQFTLAEFTGGVLMIAILVVLFRSLLKPDLLKSARQQADKGVLGRMEGHAEMDMAVTEGPLLKRIASPKGFTAVSHYFVMDWAAVWIDIALGLLIAGALSAWVPKSFWSAFFLTGHPILAKFWGPVVGPLVAIVSFVCSIGNVPLAAVLWNGGSSFGGVIAFLFADLIVLPILDIYRKYYGLKMAAFLLATMYSAMAISAIVIEFLFQALHLIPEQHKARIVETSITWNYTTILNIIFLAIGAVLVWRFVKTGGLDMLKHMNRPMSHHISEKHPEAV
jgi:uncharacterized membrane protein YraQ (UPF0718 family)